MRFSKKFKASSHCLPSPDGRLVATLLPSGIHVRAIDNLDEIAHAAALPSDVSYGSIVSFQWSLSSRRLLVATADQIMIFAAFPNTDEDSDDNTVPGPASQLSGPFYATIRNPALSVMGKPAFVSFGPVDDQVCLCSALGIKFSVFNLRTAKTVEIANPKLYSPAAACSRGFSFRPDSHHLALLTRTAGKDWVSVHDPTSAVPVASWPPDTIDAQGLAWSPNGKWLVMWESAAHGRRILFYTPDGHLFKSWTGAGPERAGVARTTSKEGEQGLSPTLLSAPDSLLGSGVRLAQFSPDSKLLGVGDASRYARIIDMTSVVEAKRLVHPTALNPQKNASLKVWQEQISLGTAIGSADAIHAFVEATQIVLPPERSPPTGPDAVALSSGCSLLTFDSSSTLLATRIEEAPSTVWIWDLETSELHTVLMLHANVLSVVWHPAIRQSLLVTCEGDQSRGLGIVWVASSGFPKAVDFTRQLQPQSNGSLSVGQTSGKLRPMWITGDSLPLTLFYTDGCEFSLATLDEGSDDQFFQPAPWPEASTDSLPQYVPVEDWATRRGRREESPLELVPAEIDSGENSELEDTFHYKREE